MNPDARNRAVSSILVIDDEPQIRRVLSNALEGIAELVIEAPTETRMTFALLIKL